MSPSCSKGVAIADSETHIGLTINQHESPTIHGEALGRVSLQASSTSFLCSQCRAIPFQRMLDEVTVETQGGPTSMVLSQRVGLDSECILCRILAERMLPCDYDYEIRPGSDQRWQLRAFSIRNMLLHSRTLSLFDHLPAAILHASDRDRAYIGHAQDEVAEMRGHLAFISTKQLAQYLNQSDEETVWAYDQDQVEASGGDDDDSHEAGSEVDSSVDDGSSQTDRSDDDSEEIESQSDTDEDLPPMRSNLISANYDIGLVKHWMSLSRGGVSLSQPARADDDDHGDGSQSDTMERVFSSGSQTSSLLAKTRSVELDIKGMMVIDCQNGQIVGQTNDMKYVALSYVWRLANDDLVVTDYHQSCQRSADNLARMLPSLIPRVVHNAIQVTLDLEYRYLWVDQFCIDQSGTEEETAEHISKMDLVYSLAELTIIAASSGGALPGVGSTPRTKQLVVDLEISDRKLGEEIEAVTIFTIPPPLERDIRNQVWFTRGWCFQESLLAQRRLYFTDHQMMFEAENTHLCDVFPERHEVSDRIFGFNFNDNPSLAWPVSWDMRLQERTEKCEYGHDDPRGRFWTESFILFDFLRTYTAKQLSCDYDAIYAFSGVFKVFSRNDLHFRSAQGLPTLDISELVVDKPDDVQRNYADFARKHFSLALEWEHLRHAQRRPGFPSWSWAGWRGQARWDRHLGETSYFTDGIDFVHVESLSGSITSIVERERTKEAYFLVGKAVLVPKSKFFLNHEWVGMSLEDRKKSPVLYEAESLYSDLDTPGNEEAEGDMARKLDIGQWECVLLNYTHDVTTGEVYGFTLLVIEWDLGVGLHQGDSVASAQPCSRVGLLKLWHKGSRNGLHETPFWNNMPKVYIRLG